MTDITSVILITAMDDGAWQESDHGNADRLQDYLLRNYQNDTISKVDHHAGGNKGMPCDVFMGGIDYLDREALLEQFWQVLWDKPEQVQLLLKGRHEQQFVIYTPPQPGQIKP